MLRLAFEYGDEKINVLARSIRIVDDTKFTARTKKGKRTFQFSKMNGTDSEEVVKGKIESIVSIFV